MAVSVPRRVLVAGCSYGGMAFVVNLLDMCAGKPARGNYEQTPPIPEALKGVPVDVHIVDERDGYYHLIGSPLAFACNESAAKFWHKFTEIPAIQHPGVRFSQASVQKVDTDRMVATIKDKITGQVSDHSYDYFLAATGLRRVWPVVPQSISQKGYRQETSDHIHSVRNASEGVVVIGGGAVGIEMAAELKVMEPQLKVTLVQSRDKLLAAEPLPDDTKDKALDLLREAGVEVILGKGRVASNSTTETADGKRVQKLVLQDGTSLTASHVINAVSNQVPTSDYLPKSSLDEDGLVKITPLMRFLNGGKNDERHLAIGDIVKWSGIKRCGGAMAMGYHASVAMFEQMLYERDGVERKLAEWPQTPPMIALAVGKSAVVYDPTEGTRFGEDQMEIFFAKDLGFKGCWDHLKLSEPWNKDDLKEVRNDSPITPCEIPNIRMATKELSLEA
ncbi:putative FAD/NAD(P)-binding domain, FAD/NAD(P)-binding domain superfamily [Septoria linicola]|nr:putative FAD/NAD(P)-binding domain, FAD/NAD(P)-binding domain superfamily [Septoria linicola]